MKLVSSNATNAKICKEKPEISHRQCSTFKRNSGIQELKLFKE